MGGTDLAGDFSAAGNREEMLRRFGELPLIAVLRRMPAEKIDQVVEVLVAAGVGLAEVTWDGPEAVSLLRRAKGVSGQALTWGMGTVTSAGQVKEAWALGARYVVTPILVEEVIAAAKASGLACVMGAFSPTEIWSAHRLGADLIKVFPAASVGPKYFTELRGPFPDIPLLAVGGVTADNAADYLRAGATGVAAGGALVPRHLVEAGERGPLLESVSRFVKAVREGLPVGHR